MIRGLEHFLCEDRQRGVGFFSLEKKQLHVEPIACQHLWGTYRIDVRVSNRECSDRMRGNSFKLKEGRFR